MAVPSTGTLSLFGIAKELELDAYTSTIPHTTYANFYQSPIPLKDVSTGGTGFDPINTGGNPSTNRPDGSTPHAMSEFYSYDHDAALADVSYALYFAEDWDDGDIGTGSRTAFNVTDLEANSVFDGGSDAVTVGGATVTGRRTWSTSPQSGPPQNYTHPSVVSDQLRLSNTNNPHGMFLKTTDYATTINITNVPNDNAMAWRFRFIMNTTNNKDMVADIRMATSNYSPNPGLSNSQYSFMIRDNADPATGGFRFMKRITTTNTQIASSPSGTYTLGTTRDFVVSWHRAGTGRSLTYTWKVGMAPTTTPTKTIIDTYNQLSVDDTTFSENFGWTFRCPKAMTTPATNVNHKYDVFSVAQIDVSVGGP